MYQSYKFKPASKKKKKIEAEVKFFKIYNKLNKIRNQVKQNTNKQKQQRKWINRIVRKIKCHNNKKKLKKTNK